MNDYFPDLPFIKEINKTLNSLSIGEDITSGRTTLISWAWQLFLANPVFGIGWGEYRTTLSGGIAAFSDLDTHNIYLQLLSETGIVGFICFIVPMFAFWRAANKIYYKCEHGKDEFSQKWRGVAFFSLALQTFFLLYGLTGNPLYDPNWQIMYFVSCGMTASFVVNENKRKKMQMKEMIGSQNIGNDIT